MRATDGGSNGFRVRVSADKWNVRQTELSITHNGYQWSTLRFENNKQIEKTIAALQAYLDAHPEPVEATNEGEQQ